MVSASELSAGMVVRIEGQIYKVLEVEAKAGAAKMGGVVKTKLINARSGRMWEPHFRPLEKLEDVELQRRVMQFLYSDTETCTFMYPDTFEQVSVPNTLVGSAQAFLTSGMELPVELFENEPINVVFPDVVEARVQNTAPACHSQQDSAWKQAALENGVMLKVPLFIAPGEMIRVNARTGQYVERARSDRRRIA